MSNVVQGSLRIEMEDRTVELRQGDAFVVPKGVGHIMLIERKTTLHTGTEVIDKTRSLAEQLRPLQP
jgi:mannose-6-phosphate isomerase-like protein (cupin superfamily)